MEFGGLKVLMISSDRNILTPTSAVSLRMKEYGKLCEELHIVLLSDSSHGLTASNLDTNIWVYPTNSSSRLFRSSGAARIGKKVVADRKFVRGKSLITAQDPFECGSAGLTIKNRWRLPLEVQLHTDPFSPYFSGLFNAIRLRIAKRVIPNADAVRVVNRALADEINTRFPSTEGETSVLPIYVDLAKVEEGKVSFDLHARYGLRFVLLSVSRLTAEKNVAQSIRVLKRVRDYVPGTGLIIVGDGPERRGLEKLAKKLGIPQAVIFAGWQEDVSSYYKTADLFVQTSHFEGYGLALVEAGLSGLPAVTTPVGIANELENGVDAVICPQGDEEYMFKSVYDLIQDSSRRETLSAHLKDTLESKLISKDAFLGKLKDNWEKIAHSISE